MPALYEAWNQEGKDIQIKGIGNNLEGALSPALVETLSKILPWCDAATPILGTCTAGHYNAETHNWAFTSADFKNRAGRGTNCNNTGTLDPTKQYLDPNTNSSLAQSLLIATDKNPYINPRTGTGTGAPYCAGISTYALNNVLGTNIATANAAQMGPNLQAAGFIKVPYEAGKTYPPGSAKINNGGAQGYGHMEVSTGDGNWTWSNRGARAAYNGSADSQVDVYIPSPEILNKKFPSATINSDALTVAGANADCDQPKTNATAFTDANADGGAQGVLPAGKPFNNPGGLPTSKPEEDGAAPEETGTKFPDQTSNSTPAGQAVANGTVEPAFLQQVKSGMGLNDLAAQNAIVAYNTAYENASDYGATAEQANIVASAFVGHIAQESGFNVNLIHRNSEGDDGQSYGILGENQDNLLIETQYLANQGNKAAIAALNATGLHNAKTANYEQSRQLASTIASNGGYTMKEQIDSIFANKNFTGGTSYSKRSGALPDLLRRSNVYDATNSMVGPMTYLVGAKASLNRQNREKNAAKAAEIFGGMDKTKLAQQAAAAAQASAAGNAAAAARSSSNTIHTTTPIGPSPVDTNGMAAGMFAVPNVGAFLWVFFQEGNPLFPVYFAASFGPAEWSSAYKASSPSPYYPNAADGTKHIGQSSIMRPNGAGGIEFNDSYGDAVGDQRKIKLFAHTGAHHMLGPNGTVMYDPHAMYKQTDGHSFDAALGNREFYTQGDANHVTIGDQLVKIGNISQEAYEAAVEHQAILEEAYKLMDQGRA
jgi:hypothetical protein